MYVDKDNFDVVDGLISLYLNQNRLEDAEPLCTEYLRKSVAKYGKRDIGIIPALRCNAVLTKRQQRLDLAIEYLTRVFIILTDVNGPVHPDVQSVVHDLINALRMMQDLPTALHYAQTNYENLINADPAASKTSISDGAYVLGTILGYVGTHKKSAEIFTIALEIREKELEPNSLIIADTLEKLAFARIKQSDFSKEVLTLLIRSLAIYKAVHGEGHSDCVRLEGLCGKIKSLHGSAITK
jgi:tetratricopeptide (TPR) repeat protein